MWRANLQRVVIFSALAASACAQLRGPVMGYLPDNGALRTLYGIPAAGWVGEALAPDRPLSRIEMSPDQSRALAVAADTGALLSLTPATGATAPLNGAASGFVVRRKSGPHLFQSDNRVAGGKDRNLAHSRPLFVRSVTYGQCR